MRRHSAVLWRLVRAPALVVGAGVVALVVTGCAPVKVGAAAIVGSQRITIAALDTEVSNLAQIDRQYSALVPLTATQETQDTLTWLVRFQINEELARQAGITVSAGQAQAALAQIYALAKADAAAQGVPNASLNLILVANGIPPDLYAEVGRYQSIDTQYEALVNGGRVPTASSAVSAANAKLQHAQCLAAKALQILVNPQFGRMDYADYEVVSAPATVWRAEGPASAASLPGLAPACLSS